MQKGIDYIGVTVSYFCHDGKGSFVMQKRGVNARDENGKWDIGGGALEFGDTVEETLLKEINEEYGTKPLTYEFIGYRDVHRVHQGRQTHWVALNFKVLLDRAHVRNAEPHKFDEIRWFSLDNLPPDSELHSQLPTFFKLFGAKL